MSEDIDIGDGHILRYFSWAPDRSIPSNAERYKGIPDIEKAGARIVHPAKDSGEPCRSAIHFDVPGAKEVFGGAAHVWQVESWEPLTVSPSILCSCGDHGFIRGGKWVKA